MGFREGRLAVRGLGGIATATRGTADGVEGVVDRAGGVYVGNGPDTFLRDELRADDDETCGDRVTRIGSAFGVCGGVFSTGAPTGLKGMPITEGAAFSLMAGVLNGGLVPLPFHPVSLPRAKPRLLDPTGTATGMSMSSGRGREDAMARFGGFSLLCLVARTFGEGWGIASQEAGRVIVKGSKVEQSSESGGEAVREIGELWTEIWVLTGLCTLDCCCC